MRVMSDALPLPVPVLPAPQRSWPLHGTAASRLAEQQGMAGLAPHTLMQRAGLAVARLALALAPHARRVWIAAGPGNNGGDGLQAAAALKCAGREVVVSFLGDVDRLPADARNAFEAARQAGVTIDSSVAPGGGVDLAIDALLGLGSSRAPDGRIAEAVASLNACAAPVLAIDLPSGLDADQGARFGDLAVRATHTLSLLTLKPGLFTGEGRDHAGRVWFGPLGVPTLPPADAWLTGCEAVATSWPARQHAQHKGSFGDVVVVGGAPGMSGAVWLAARAALAAGAGRVYVDPLDGLAMPGHALELMCRPGLSREQDAMARSTVVCGCGGGAAVADVLPAVLQHASRLVLDADGLNAVAADAALQTLLATRASQHLATLITPHPLEAARLLGVDTASVQKDRLGAARQLAQRLSCAVLLKGSGTVCAAPGEPPWINPTGNALLASAGTGDVLAGWTGGRWAQHADAPAVLREAKRVAAASAWWHGMAAERAASAGRVTPLTASLLTDAMAAEPLA
jgi:hydroxyethylthiazole kinase-like uncharacterized protein yjeF